LVYTKGNNLLSYKNIGIFKRDDEKSRKKTFAQRVPVAEKEQRVFSRNKPLSSMLEPLTGMA
jgi:hypothetical protein